MASLKYFTFRIILFLHQQKIFSFGHELIFSWYANKRSIDYFIPELKLINQFKNYKQIENYEEYISKRKIGENDAPICECIRHDSVDKFITYIENFQYLNGITVQKKFNYFNSLI